MSVYAAIADIAGFDPDNIDLAFYSVLAVLSVEQIVWWFRQYREMKHPVPGIVLPALLSNVGITLALAVMVFVSFSLAWPMSVHHRLFWNPIARRVQGFALLAALLSHWWWRIAGRGSGGNG